MKLNCLILTTLMLYLSACSQEVNKEIMLNQEHWPVTIKSEIKEPELKIRDDNPAKLEYKLINNLKDEYLELSLEVECTDGTKPQLIYVDTLSLPATKSVSRIIYLYRNNFLNLTGHPENLFLCDLYFLKADNTVYSRNFFKINITTP